MEIVLINCAAGNTGPGKLLRPTSKMTSDPGGL